MAPVWPNFFIIGAPKCGTTAMSYYLANHPDIYMSEQNGEKEPYYYASDIKFPEGHAFDYESYRNLFKSAPPQSKYLGEASVWYAYSDVALTRIRNQVPEAKLLMMIRNPLEILPALHNQLFKSWWENEKDVETAWNLQAERRDGKRLPRIVPDGKILQYGEICKLGKQIQRIYKIFPQQQILILRHQDFVNNPKACYQEALKFLDLPDDGRDEFPRRNQRVTFRSFGFESVLSEVAYIRKKLRLPGGFGLLRRLHDLNVRHGEVEMSNEFRKRLCRYFYSDLELLSHLLNDNFMRWLDY